MPIIKIHNVQSGEVIEREMNEQELANYQEIKSDAEEIATAQAEASAKRATLLEKLGITEEEAKLLLS